MKLNIAEQKLAIYLAEKRYRANREVGTSTKYYSRDDLETRMKNELTGMAGEIAFCKIFNVYPDTDIKKWDYKDAILASGLTVDVKTTFEKGKLIACISKKDIKKPDLYALMTGEFPEYNFKGFIEAENFIIKDCLDNLGYGPTYVMEQNKLKHESEILMGKVDR